MSINRNESSNSNIVTTDENYIIKTNDLWINHYNQINIL